jgi:hypothetical protein
MLLTQGIIEVNKTILCNYNNHSKPEMSKICQGKRKHKAKQLNRIAG